MGSQRALVSAWRAESAIVMGKELSPQVTVIASRSMLISVSGLASTAAARAAMSSRAALTQGIPRVVELPKKISAKDSAMTARNPDR